MHASRELSGFISRIKPIFLTAAAFSMVVNLLMLVPSLYMLQVYDRVLTSRNVDTLLMLTLLATGLYVLLAFTEWVRSQLLINASIDLDAQLSPRVFDAFIESSAGARGSAAGQAFSNALNVRQFLTGSGLFALFDAPWAPIYLVVIFMIHPGLGLVSLVGAVLLVVLAWVSHRVTAQPLSMANEMQGLSTQTALGYGRNHESVLVMGMMRTLRQRWLARQEQAVAFQSEGSRLAGALASASRLIRLVQQMAILGVGALLAIKGEISPGGMIAASILMGRALAPLDQAIGSWRQFISARAAYDRLGELLAQSPPQPQTMELPAPAGDITIENLTLIPPGAEAPVLMGVDFRIKPGMAVGVIGPSGSGKSCLARALTGVWLPAKGSIRIDGALITDLDRDRLGPHMGYLPQSIELFEGTIAENISRFGEQDPEKIVAAAKSAGIHELVLRLPKGYESPIGPDGISLSGGQRQRVALARAIYGRPRFVVLDEPNSNLDDQGEAALMNVMAEMKNWGTTVVIITHRRAILSATDGLLVLKEGKLHVYGPTGPVLKELSA